MLKCRERQWIKPFFKCSKNLFLWISRKKDAESKTEDKEDTEEKEKDEKEEEEKGKRIICLLL